jgi:hypothetical protein
MNMHVHASGNDVCVQLATTYVCVGCQPETRIELLILH